MFGLDYTYSILFSVVWKKERALTNDLLPSKVYCGSSREREGEKRDPLFLILLSTFMSSTLEVQEHYSLIVKDISRSLFLSFTFVYCSVFNAFAAFRSVCDEKRKRNNFKLLFEHTYMYILALFCSLFPLHHHHHHHHHASRLPVETTTDREEEGPKRHIK